MVKPEQVLPSPCSLQHAELNSELRLLTLIQLPDQRLQPQGRPSAVGADGEGDAVAACGVRQHRRDDLG